MKLPTLVFDMDGVLLDSLAIKQNAFAALFKDYPEQLPLIRAYNESNQGISRVVKIRHVCTQILGLWDVEERVQTLLDAYRRSLEQPMAAAPLLPGVREFLASAPHAKFVSSSAPAQDVADALQLHGIRRYFAGVHGYPESKGDVLARLKQEWGMPIIFFGDALADYEAAQTAGVFFVGVESQGDRQPFRDLDVQAIVDFTDQRALDAILEGFTGGEDSPLPGSSQLPGGFDERQNSEMHSKRSEIIRRRLEEAQPNSSPDLSLDEFMADLE